jgi:hypothetical protein
LLANSGQFAVKPLLEAVRAECGDAEFGYRMQGMFAHVLVRLGAVVLEVNAQGHPDIKARLADELIIVQVKSCEHRRPSSMFQLSKDDLSGITSGDRTKGYLAFLDCADPISWHLVNFATARQFLNRCVPIAALTAAQDQQFSTDCTDVFTEIVLSAKDRLSVLTFPLLTSRAIQGRPP